MTGIVNDGYELVPIDSLETHPENPRQGDLGAIGDSIAHNGFYGAVVAQRSTGRVLAGNHRLLAARQQGLSEVPVTWVDVDDVQAKRIMLVDNRSNDVASYDTAALVEVLRGLDDLAGTGYDGDDLDDLIRMLDEPFGSAGSDTAPSEPPADPVTVLGDVWELGPHRLVCGDSTDPETVRTAMGGGRAKLMATDPPYLVGYQGGNHRQSSHNKTEVKDKHWDDYREHEGSVDFYIKFLQAAINQALTDEPAVYQWHAFYRQNIVMKAWEHTGLLHHQQIIWVKSRAVLTRSCFMWQHEPCIYGWIQGHRPHLLPPNNETTVWNVDQKGESDGIHPTQKPVALFERPIGWHTRPDDTIYEPFASSGTAIIAAHNTGRRCCGIELSPAFCDVICARFQAHTGITPTRGGTPHNFTNGASPTPDAEA